MAYFLFFLYVLLCSWGISRIRFFRKSGLSSKRLLIYFWIKVAAAVGYGYYHALVQRGGDTWNYHRSGLIELALLRSDPVRFFTSVFHSDYPEKWGGFFSTRNSWWNDLDDNTIPKLLAICNIFSGSNYYINVVFVNFLFLFGPVLLYQLWSKALPDAKIVWRYLPFLLPSFLFWTSGIHKEGFLLLALALVVYGLFSFAEKNNRVFRNSLLFLAGTTAILVLRNFMLLPIALITIGWAGVYKLRLLPAVGFGAAMLIAYVLFFASGLLSPKLNLPQILHERRAAFLQKEGASKTETVQLAPTSVSFLQHAPAAFVVGAFRPLPADAYNTSSAIAAAESVILVLLPFAALFRLRKAYWNHPFLLLCLSISVSTFLIIGYTVPFLGAVVRYRSVVLPFWIMSFILVSISKRSNQH